MRVGVVLAVLGSAASLAAQAPAPSPTPVPITAIRAARMFDGRSNRGLERRRARRGLEILAAGLGPRDSARRAGHRPRRRDAPPGFHRQPHAPHRRVGGRLVPRTSSRRCAAPRRSTSVLRRPRAARSKPASPPSATSARTSSSTSACATRSMPGVVARTADAGRASTASAPGRPLRPHRVPRRAPSAQSAGSTTGSPTAPTSARQAVRLDDQVRRRRDQGVRHRRRALARRRVSAPAAHRGRDERPRRGGAPARRARPRRTPTAPRPRGRRSGPASTRSSTARFSTTKRCALMKEKGTFLVPTRLAGAVTGGKLERLSAEIAAKAKAAAEAHDDLFRRAVQSRRPDRLRHRRGRLAARQERRRVRAPGRGRHDPARRRCGPRACGGGASRARGPIGTLEKGKLADVVAVPGDPLADIGVMENVVFVMKGGQVAKSPAR